MHDGFRQITIDPSLPCVYHDCDRPATTAIAYEVSEHEWRMVPTCERHTVPIPGQNKRPSDAARREKVV
jgi:hypothetical protein